MSKVHFDFGNNDAVEGYQNRIKNQILGSYKGNEAILTKGISVEEFDKAYPADKFERFSFDSLNKAKDELSKGENFSQDQFDQEVSTMKPVIVQHQNQKRLMYVREKKA